MAGVGLTLRIWATASGRIAAMPSASVRAQAKAKSPVKSRSVNFFMVRVGVAPGLRPDVGELADGRDLVLDIASDQVIGHEDGEADEELFDVHVFCCRVLTLRADSALEAPNALRLGN